VDDFEFLFLCVFFGVNDGIVREFGVGGDDCDCYWFWILGCGKVEEIFG